MNAYDYKKRCAKCGRHKPTAGGHQKVVPGRGVYFVCAECKAHLPRRRSPGSHLDQRLTVQSGR